MKKYLFYWDPSKFFQQTLIFHYIFGQKFRHPAKLYFQRAKNMGLTKKYLTRYEMDEDTFSQFESELKIIGEIE